MWLAAAGIRWRVDAPSARAGCLAQRLGQTVETNRSRDPSRANGTLVMQKTVKRSATRLRRGAWSAPLF
nr:MAG TPA: hypothetical protein [Caudoviricetes sp.]